MLSFLQSGLKSKIKAVRFYLPVDRRGLMGDTRTVSVDLQKFLCNNTAKFLTKECELCVLRNKKENY